MPDDRQGLPSSDEKTDNPASPITTATTSRTDSTVTDSLNKDIEGGERLSRKLSWLERCSLWLSKSSKESEASEGPETDAYTVHTKNLENSPEGYAKVAVFQSSDRNFSQYRGFGSLHSRVLSGLQYEVECLEQELDKLDQCDNNPQNKRKLTSKTRDETQSPQDFAAGRYPEHLKRSRPEVLSALKTKLLEYDEFLLKTRDMGALQRPSKRDYESVRTWFRDVEPIVRREAQFIRRKEDIVTLRVGRECAGFDSFIERCLGTTDKFLQRWFRCQMIRYLFLTPELREKCKNDEVRYYSPSRIDSLVNAIITAVIFVLLILPVVIMYELTNLGARQSALDAIGVLVVFTLVFGMAISSLTTARRQELFGACAAYCAVLVVFIGNFTVQQVELKKPLSGY